MLKINFLLFRFRFHEHWRFVLQRLAFLSAFVVYLESETLVTRDEVAQILGSRYQFGSRSSSLDGSVLKKVLLSTQHFSFFGAVEVVQDKGFHLDLEDYLAGVLIMASELVGLF